MIWRQAAQVRTSLRHCRDMAYIYFAFLQCTVQAGISSAGACNGEAIRQLLAQKVVYSQVALQPRQSACVNGMQG